MTWGSLFPAFTRFAAAQIRTGDLDPAYPVLATLYRAEGLRPETALWRTALYVCWYSLESAQAAWARWPEPESFDARWSLEPLPTGIERRGHRGRVGMASALRNLSGMLAASSGDLLSWVRRLAAAGGRDGWKAVREGFQAVDGNGPWASYKWADLLAHVHGLPIEANDLGVGGGSETAGPIPGLMRLTGRGFEVSRDRALHEALLLEGRAAGAPFSGLDQVETALCDFNSLCKGHYYVGHDIDVQQVQVARSPALRLARFASFEPRVLGELNGWLGVRPERKRLWVDHGLAVPPDLEGFA